MSSFANLKRGRSDLAKLTKAIEATSQPAEAGSKDDTRFWQPEVDKAGNGMAVIRFLPAPAADGDDALPWVRVFSHGFQGPGGWFIDNCLTTVNEKCPVCEHNSTLWNSGIEANKDIARKQKRKLSYVANILVISDPSNPANEGQVRLYKFGKKIFDKMNNIEVICCTYPNSHLLYKLKTFKNNTQIFSYSLVERYFNKVQSVMLHLPEIFTEDFNNRAGILRFKGDIIHLNILNQNINLMPDETIIHQLKNYFQFLLYRDLLGFELGYSIHF